MANVGIPASTVTRRIENGIYAAGRTWTAPANLSNNDTMDIAVVPAGARLLGVHIKSDAATASQTIDIGDGTDVDRFLDGSTALQTAESVASANLGLGDVLSTSADTTIRVTFLGDAPDSGDVITAWCEISVDDLQADSSAAA